MSAESLIGGGNVINGIDLDRVAALVSNQPRLDATRQEHIIADAVRKYGERIEMAQGLGNGARAKDKPILAGTRLRDEDNKP
jgi:hypothetical protein